MRGLWKNEQVWWGMERGVVGLAPINPKVPTQVNQFIKEKKQKIIDGTFKIFQGPLKDQQGKTVFARRRTF